MTQNNRNRRLRLFVKHLNKARKLQAKKIDILCNDFIVAQREFIKSLLVINFTANFYESIVGKTDLSALLYTAGRVIKERIPDANVIFFLRQQDGCQLHMVESDHPIAFEKNRLENCFTPELIEHICTSNKLCTLDDMVAMGLQGTPTCLSRISAFTIPLGQFGSSLGFILICRSSENELTLQELSSITAVTPGLSAAIQSCQTLCHLAD